MMRLACVWLAVLAFGLPCLAVAERPAAAQAAANVSSSGFLTEARQWLVSWLCDSCPANAFLTVGLKDEGTEGEGEGEPPAVSVYQTVLAEGYTAGEPLDIQIELRFESDVNVTALGLYQTLPEGWTFGYTLASSPNLPPITPLPGEEGRLEFAYIQVPAFPIRFEYRVNVPEGVRGTQYLSGQALYRTTGEELYSAVAVTELNPVNSPCCGCAKTVWAAPDTSPLRRHAGDSLVVALLALALAAGSRRR